MKLGKSPIPFLVVRESLGRDLFPGGRGRALNWRKCWKRSSELIAANLDLNRHGERVRVVRGALGPRWTRSRWGALRVAVARSARRFLRNRRRYRPRYTATQHRSWRSACARDR